MTKYEKLLWEYYLREATQGNASIGKFANWLDIQDKMKQKSIIEKIEEAKEYAPVCPGIHSFAEVKLYHDGHIAGLATAIEILEFISKEGE